MTPSREESDPKSNNVSETKSSITPHASPLPLNALLVGGVLRAYRLFIGRTYRRTAVAN